MRHRESKRTGRSLEEIIFGDANLIILAERELAAFARAVRELFGPEQASLSTAEWIDELKSLNWPAGPRAADFRRITTAASVRLARRELFIPPIRPIGATTDSRRAVAFNKAEVSHT
jgi:hypothetical protein